MRTPGSPTELEHRRRLAVQRVLEGYSTAEVADFLGIDPRSVRRWLADFQEHGSAGLASQPVSGRPPTLTTTQEKIVRRWLADSPTAHGFATELWTAARLAQLMRLEFGVSFNPRYLCAWLRQRGFTPQKPRRLARERDEDAIATWLAEDWPRIKKKARQQGASLLVLDESGLLMAPLVRRSWALKGLPPVVRPKAGHREKVSVVAALWLTPRRDLLELTFQTMVNGYFDNEAVADFLRTVLPAVGSPVVVIWDGGSMHKGDAMDELVEASAGRLDLERLPAYAPELNPVEQVWTWLKYSRLCNFAPADAVHLEEAILRELDAIRTDQQRLRNLFHASDLPLPRTLLS